MSMTTLVIIRFISIFAVYFCLTVLAPAIVFRRWLKGLRVAEQFLICYVTGNFYVINLVFVLQLLHISHPATLWVGTVIPAFLAWSKINRIPLREKVREFFAAAKRLSRGTLGLKMIWHRMLYQILIYVRKGGRIFYQKVVKKTGQWMFVVVIVFSLFWIYGRGLILAYGYAASDIPVHISWINQMSRGNMFSAGVYPFGFHCMMYYLHAAFGFDTYVLLCQFFFVQVICIHFVLLAFLKLCCKTTYLPYAGTLFYVLGNFWGLQTYSRFYATLPQEFGMIFVLPSVYFAIAFFQTHRERLAGKKIWRDRNLLCFAMSFSLTLAIHFYGTMVAGLCCIGIAVGFFFRFVRKEYFGKIMLTGIISVVIAVFPMGVAYATGTPLQGSLGWGMSVIHGTSNEDALDSEIAENSEITEAVTESSEISTEEENRQSADKEQLTETETSTEEQLVVPKKSMKQKITGLCEQLAERIIQFILPGKETPFGYLIMTGIVVAGLLGLALCVTRRTDYGMMLIAVSAYMMIMTLLLDAGELGLPVLMDPARCSIYYVYLFIAVPVLFVDGSIYFLLGFRRLNVLRNLISLVLTGTLLIGMNQYGMIRQNETFGSDFVSNGAITCLSNIIHDNADHTWTIISANDETQMGLDHGYHTETISFLRQMEYLTKDTTITIPTASVYFFVEKVPLNYAVPYAKSGQSISKAGALQALPNVGGIGMYQGENRWILMSRMYYWAQTFEKLYPDAMSVYYESDQFICYKLDQNMYHLYNLAIDYGYNQIVDEQME